MVPEGNESQALSPACYKGGAPEIVGGGAAGHLDLVRQRAVLLVELGEEEDVCERARARASVVLLRTLQCWCASPPADQGHLHCFLPAVRPFRSSSQVLAANLHHVQSTHLPINPPSASSCKQRNVQ